MATPLPTHVDLFEKQDCENAALVRGSWIDRSELLGQGEVSEMSQRPRRNEALYNGAGARKNLLYWHLM